MKDFIMEFLILSGFEVIDGPEIESEKYNFDMLNIKETHPARQMHDTFYVNSKYSVLRTHTSPVQIRGMLDKKPPFALCFTRVSQSVIFCKDRAQYSTKVTKLLPKARQVAHPRTILAPTRTILTPS